MTYRMLVLELQISLFRFYFPRSRSVRVDTSFHLVAPSIDVEVRYLNFGEIYDFEENVSWWATHSVSANLDHLAVSFDEDNLCVASVTKIVGSL